MLDGNGGLTSRQGVGGVMSQLQVSPLQSQMESWPPQSSMEVKTGGQGAKLPSRLFPVVPYTHGHLLILQHQTVSRPQGARVHLW
jgi:hypothetical protein